MTDSVFGFGPSRALSQQMLGKLALVQSGLNAKQCQSHTMALLGHLFYSRKADDVEQTVMQAEAQRCRVKEGHIGSSAH